MARVLNGTNQGFSIASGATNVEITGDLSIAVRYRTNDTFAGQMVIDASNTGASAGWWLALANQSADRFTLWHYGIGFGTNIKSGADVPEDTAWHTLVVVADSVGGGVKFFVDGVDTGNTGNTFVGAAAGSGATKYIGRDVNGSQWWNGGLAELALWNAALTDDEAVSYHKGLSPLLIRPSLRRAYWPLMGRYSPEIDVVGGANATLVSTPTAGDHPPVIRPARRRFSQTTTAASYTLTAPSGSYAETGTAATLRLGRKVGASSGTYTETGTAAGLRRGYTVAAGSGTYTETGTAAGLKATRRLTASSGSYSETGTAATLRFGHKVTAGAASYTETGTSATLRFGHKVGAASGTYALTGTDATLTSSSTSKTLAAASGSYTETGSDATLRVGHRVTASAGSYVETGTSSTLRLGRVLASASGSFAEAGTAAGVRLGRRLGSASGLYVLTGTDATLQTGANPQLAAGAGSYTWTGSSVGLRTSRRLTSASSSYLWTGADAVLVYAGSGGAPIIPVKPRQGIGVDGRQVSARGAAHDN